ncbi:MAG: exosome complex RNA-binding protein Csl4 [Candidatus Bathyarchaeia archaeon]|nr:exosome complex RNA-binding protein Csl4 [Candidatus Bathyarchaeia archaeon]
MNAVSSERESGKFVLPGERLGVIEEFIPDAGTYVMGGIIHSKIVGRALLDFLNKRVSVYPLIPKARIPKVGSVVLGQVSYVQTENAGVRIFKIGNNPLSGFFSGILHVSDVQQTYVKSMFDVCKPGDIIRAKVISEKNRVYHLYTKDRELGVVYAFCSRCGYMLELKRYIMRCARCGKIEKRKIALDYGKGML